MAEPEKRTEGPGATLVRDAESTLVRDVESTLVRDPALSAADTLIKNGEPQSVSKSGSSPVQPEGSLDAPVTIESPGRYTLRREFGRGGQAVVWLANDKHIGRDVALKLLASGSGDGLVDVLRLDDARELPPPDQALRTLLDG